MHIPESLLVDQKHVEFVGNTFRIGTEAKIGFRQKTFLENYEEEFSWGQGRQDTEKFLQMMRDAPAELREVLKSPFNAEAWLTGATAEALQARFLQSRVIGYKGRRVIMPIVELANHGHAARYLFDDGIGLSGQFLVRFW